MDEWDTPEMVFEDMVQQLISEEDYAVFAEDIYLDTQGDIYVEGKRVY